LAGAGRLAVALITALPLLLAAVKLSLEALSLGTGGLAPPVPPLLSLLVLPVLVALPARGHGPAALLSRLLATPALLAPIAVCFPWTVAPSHLGLAFGEFAFFLHWLTKYPSWGAVNHEVLLGILCVLGCAFLPWLAAALRLHGNSGRGPQAVLLGLVLIPYVPVLIRLDATLFLAGVLGGRMPFQPGPPIWVTFGPVLRLASILSMIGLLLDLRRPAGGSPE